MLCCRCRRGFQVQHSDLGGPQEHSRCAQVLAVSPAKAVSSCMNRALAWRRLLVLRRIWPALFNKVWHECIVIWGVAKSNSIV